MNKVYFPGLDGVRCVAVLFVVITHIENFKNYQGYPSLFDHSLINPLISNLGKQGVKIFFVLSGFLISYLLLQENKFTKTVNLASFYKRRILRIWPLYYLILLFGFLIAPYFFNLNRFNYNFYQDFNLKFLLGLFFMPNFLFYYYGSILFVSVLWSVGAEEQFYLFWPLVFKYVKKRLFFFILFLFALMIIIKISLMQLISNTSASQTIRLLDSILKMFQYDAMIMGGVFSYFLFTNHTKIISFLFSRTVQIVSILLIGLFILSKPDFFVFDNLIYGLLYGTVILNIAANPKSILRLENTTLTFLGRISYGIYIYHSVFIAIGISYFSKYLLFKDLFLSNLILYLFTIFGTITFAFLSYTYLEKPILGYKKRFMIIKSGNI